MTQVLLIVLFISTVEIPYIMTMIDRSTGHTQIVYQYHDQDLKIITITKYCSTYENNIYRPNINAEG